ncbi:MAG: MarR family transcriptional regulator [Legionella sp.]|nr:MarR family transcriptional regulator [Legionella sp.]
MYTSTLIKKAARLLEKKANVLLKPHNIMHGFTYFLMALYEQDGQTQTELQKTIGIEQSTVVRTLDRMQRDGLIERKQSPTDRRVFNIYLTKKGLSCKDAVLSSAVNLNELLLQPFSENEQEIIRSYLQRLINNLESN